jgi:allantoinase
MSSPPYDMIVRGGLVVTHQGRSRLDIGVLDGRVAALGVDLGEAADLVDAEGLIVIPGLVDAHVHLREPGMTEKEGFHYGTRAAAAGGVTTVFDMPNTVPPVATVDAFDDKLALIAPKAHIDFGLYGLLSQDNAAAIPVLADRGAIGLKVYMGQTTGDNPCPDDAAILRGLRAAADAGLVVGAHAENDKVLRMLAGELRAAGRTDPIAHLESRPEYVEEEAVGRFLLLARAAGADAHIHHLSTAAGLDQLVRARAARRGITAEVLVAHLLLDDEAYGRNGNLVKLNPPVRPRSDVEAMWRGVSLGFVEVLATDHAPHTVEEQARENVWEAPAGFIGVETMLPLMLTQVSAERLSLEDLVRMACWAPARIWSISDRKGHLDVGADADFNLVDLEAPGTIEGSRLHSLHPVSPYEGWKTVGAAVRTYLRGALVAEDGQAVGAPSGSFVTPRRDR